MSQSVTRPGFAEISSIQSVSAWLRNYYLARAVVSAAWIGGALTAGRDDPHMAALLFIAYPAWDAVANYFDATGNGGLRRNPTQTLNLAVSTVTTAAVAVALQFSLFAVLGVFGVWAILSGLLQLATAARRWKSYGAQWAMGLSGAQSTLAGIYMATLAAGTHTPGIKDITGYAAFGAFYFLVSAIWLTVSNARRRAASAALSTSP